MATIDIGSSAIDRVSYQGNNRTLLDKHNPANGTGTLTSFEIYAVSGNNVTGLKVGTFYGSGTSWTYRDHEEIGNVTAGSKQTFTGKNCDVSSGDYLAWYISGGLIEQSVDSPATEIAVYKLNYDAFSAGTHTLNDNTSNFKLAWSVYATGATAGGGPTPAIKVGGVWKETTSQKIKVGGVWKAISNIKVKVSGVWKSAT